MVAQGVVIPYWPDRVSALRACDEIGALADRVNLELPRLVERIRLIDQPRPAEERAA